METSRELTPGVGIVSNVSGTGEQKKKKKEHLRIFSILDVARLPVNISHQHRPEPDRVIDATEAEVHNPDLIT